MMGFARAQPILRPWRIPSACRPGLEPGPIRRGRFARAL